MSPRTPAPDGFSPAVQQRLREMTVDETPTPRQRTTRRQEAVVRTFLTEDLPTKDIAVKHGYTQQRVQEILRKPWAKRMIGRARQLAEKRLLEEAVPAQVHLKRAAARMAQIVTAMAEVEDQKPRDRAEVALKALEFAGEKPAEKKVSLTLDAQLGQLSVEELERFVTKGIVPAALRHEMDPVVDVTPEEPDDDTSH